MVIPPVFTTKADYRLIAQHRTGFKILQDLHVNRENHGNLVDSVPDESPPNRTRPALRGNSRHISLVSDACLLLGRDRVRAGY